MGSASRVVARYFRRADHTVVGAESHFPAWTDSMREANRKLGQQVAERARAEEVRERLAAMIESSDDAIISKTLDGTITAWNPGAEKLFGYSSSEAVGQPMQMLLPPERADEDTGILARIGRGERVNHLEPARVR